MSDLVFAQTESFPSEKTFGHQNQPKHCLAHILTIVDAIIISVPLIVLSVVFSTSITEDAEVNFDEHHNHDDAVATAPPLLVGMECQRLCHTTKCYQLYGGTSLEGMDSRGRSLLFVRSRGRSGQ